MKTTYDSDTDALYLYLTDELSVDSEEIAPGVVVDMGADGEIVGLDIDLSLIRAILRENTASTGKGHQS